MSYKQYFSYIHDEMMVIPETRRVHTIRVFKYFSTKKKQIIQIKNWHYDWPILPCNGATTTVDH
jgi:hypothetical protein